MKKIMRSLLFVLLANTGLMAQAVLPTSWSFSTTTYPTGWTATGTGFYSASGNTPPACKFDSTGDLLEIYFNAAPGNLTYYLTGNSFSGGTFIVEESPDGITYTTLHTHTSPPAATYTMFTDVPNASSRYIRFNYVNKVSGNIGLDDVNIDAAPAGPNQEINVVYASNTVVDGGQVVLSAPVSTLTPFNFSIENQGTVNTLNISNASLSGPDMADFSIASFPSTVSASGSSNLVLNFTPSSAGSKFVTLTIDNDDSDENPYIINIYGIGGSFATEPAAQPTNLTFTNVKSYRFNSSYTAASGAPEGYIILRRDGAAVTDAPVDGTSYKRGDIIGNSQVIFSGDVTSFMPKHIVANTTYHFAVFSYNGPNGYENYLTTSPLTGSVTTTGSMQPANYYTGVNTANTSFVTDLHNKIYPHNVQYYSNYGPLVVALFAARDTVNDQRVITCVYSGHNQVYTEPFDWTQTGFSREHSYCHQWMPTYPSTTGDEYQDYHQLFPTDQNNANAIRSNYPLGEVANATYTFMGCKLGTDVYGNTVFEPRDQHKGDAARAIMYEAVCYTSVGGSWALPNPISGTIPYGQDQNILKKWHYQDLPDNWEIARNDFIDSLQGNRNPFVDSVQFACYIDFSTMTYINSPAVPCNTLGLNEADKYEDYSYLYPNPNQGMFTLNYSSAKSQQVSIDIFDMLGNVVFTRTYAVNTGVNPLQMNFQDLKKGVYFVQILGENSKAVEKLVIE